jgi:hypothetical protein
MPATEFSEPRISRMTRISCTSNPISGTAEYADYADDLKKRRSIAVFTIREIREIRGFARSATRALSDPRNEGDSR